uniref:CULT domain-containing protein n=1 Tax=Panagrellus redivivus TaxID=6233 RepID=A0A7E4UTF9_PANRE
MQVAMLTLTLEDPWLTGFMPPVLVLCSKCNLNAGKSLQFDGESNGTTCVAYGALPMAESTNEKSVPRLGVVRSVTNDGRRNSRSNLLRTRLLAPISPESTLLRLRKHLEEGEEGNSDKVDP